MEGIISDVFGGWSVKITYIFIFKTYISIEIIWIWLIDPLCLDKKCDVSCSVLRVSHLIFVWSSLLDFKIPQIHKNLALCYMQGISVLYKRKGLEAHLSGYQGLLCSIVGYPPESYYDANDANREKGCWMKPEISQKAVLLSGGLC